MQKHTRHYIQKLCLPTTYSSASTTYLKSGFLTGKHEYLFLISTLKLYSILYLRSGVLVELDGGDKGFFVNITDVNFISITVYRINFRSFSTAPTLVDFNLVIWAFCRCGCFRSEVLRVKRIFRVSLIVVIWTPAL